MNGLTTIGRFRVTKPTQTSVAAYREIQRGSPPSITQHFSPPARADRDPFVGVGQRGLARYRGSRSARVAAGVTSTQLRMMEGPTCSTNYRRRLFAATTRSQIVWNERLVSKWCGCDGNPLTRDAARIAPASRHRRRSHPAPASRSRPMGRLPWQATAARPRAARRDLRDCRDPCHTRSVPRRRLPQRTRARTARWRRARRVPRARGDRAPARRARQRRARAAREVSRTDSRRRARCAATVRAHSQRSASIGSSCAAFRAG